MRALLDLVLPATCAACERPGDVACEDCARPLRAAARRVWPQPTPSGMPPAYSVAVYADAPRVLLLAYKERGAVGLQRVLGAALAEATRACLQRRPPGGITWLVPVPSRRAARIERGDDVLARLARVAARQLRLGGAPVRVLPALRHVRAVQDSAGLSAAQRSVNLAGAFRLRAGAARLLEATPVVIIDDLLTTGATVTEVGRTLTAAGAQVYGAATIAATSRRRGNG